MLYRCISCDTQISARAHTCPTCGEPDAGPKASSAYMESLRQKAAAELAEEKERDELVDRWRALLRKHPRVRDCPRARHRELIDAFAAGKDVEKLITEIFEGRHQTAVGTAVVLFVIVALMAAWAVAGRG